MKHLNKIFEYDKTNLGKELFQDKVNWDLYHELEYEVTKIQDSGKELSFGICIYKKDRSYEEIYNNGQWNKYIDNRRWRIFALKYNSVHFYIKGKEMGTDENAEQVYKKLSKRFDIIREPGMTHTVLFYESNSESQTIKEFLSKKGYFEFAKDMVEVYGYSGLCGIRLGYKYEVPLFRDTEFILSQHVTFAKFQELLKTNPIICTVFFRGKEDLEENIKFWETLSQKYKITPIVGGDSSMLSEISFVLNGGK